MARKTSNLTSTEMLTDEQISKRAVGVEDVDLGGFIKRHRVLSQTVFDIMFIREFISQPEHEAAHQFMGDFGESGGVPRSANMDSENHTPGHSVSSAMGERRMIFSKPYRAMCDGASEEDVSFFISLTTSAYDYSSSQSVLKETGRRCRRPLSALSRHYGTDGRTDPRDIIRRQVGAPPRHKQKRGGAR
jgi:hypothetical protein